MREIKFRAWNEVLEKMYNWYDFLNTNMKNTFIAPESTGMILMQYVGLKDKNGTEIYEGDIIKVPVKRHSSSNWWQNTNINHGDCGDFVYKKVEYVKYAHSFQENLGGFSLIDMPITQKQKEEIAKPRGKERIEQCVDDINYSFQELEVIGNIYENSELLEKKV